LDATKPYTFSGHVTLAYKPTYLLDTIVAATKTQNLKNRKPTRALLASVKMLVYFVKMGNCRRPWTCGLLWIGKGFQQTVKHILGSCKGALQRGRLHREIESMHTSSKPDLSGV
jgi:hypothetical protein